MRGERLFQTVEEIRRSRFTDLDPELVAEILSSQIQMQEDRAEAQRRTERAIATWASTDAIASGKKS
jgi:Uma2 family endonuclease